jgi:hypothetical protein
MIGIINRPSLSNLRSGSSAEYITTGNDENDTPKLNILCKIKNIEHLCRSYIF